MVISLRRFYKPALITLAILIAAVGGWGIVGKVLKSGYGAGEGMDAAAADAFMTAIDCFATGNSEIEIFDISKGEVVKRVKLTSEIQSRVEGYVGKITGLYVKVKAFPEKGQIVKVPLEPQIEVQNKWLNSYGVYVLSEVYIIFPEDADPYLLILDPAGRPVFFNFEQKPKLELSELLDD
jgi:hypothetical protein